MTARRQLMLPAARHWPRRGNPHWDKSAEWMVWKGWAETEAEAAVMVSEMLWRLIRGELPAADAAEETRNLDALDKMFDAAPVIMKMLCARGGPAGNA